MALAMTPQAWTYAAPLIAIVVIIARGARERALRIERMWIMPALVLIGVVASFAAQPPPRILALLAALAALGLGALVGWWRGRTTRISIDPQSHALTSRASPIGMALVAGVVVLRLSLRDYAVGHASTLHVTTTEITDIFLMFAAGLVCAQRLEMWLRAGNLLEQARKA